MLLLATGGEGAIKVAETILKELDRPFALERYMVNVGVSIGIILAPEQGEDAVTLVRRPDVAMYTAKRAGGGYAFYATEQDPYTLQRLDLGGELRHAIEHDGLCPHYQPKVNLKTGQLAGVETLVRRPCPERGLLPSGEFIRLAESTGLIVPLSRCVLATALHQCRDWQEMSLEIPITVNLSARLLQDEDLVETIAELLTGHGVQPENLELEIAESAVMADPSHALNLLHRLHTMGIKLSIDDFGTGYSSLAYLHCLPVDEVKIDKSFVVSLSGGDDGAAIVHSIIDLGYNLGLIVVAEGVENGAVYDLLAGMACDIAQGYYLSRPVSAQDLTAWVRLLPWQGSRVLEDRRRAEFIRSGDSTGVRNMV